MPGTWLDWASIETEEAGKILRNSTPDQLRKKKAEAKKKRGPSILRDAWLSPLTLNERGKPGAQASRSGVRASDKGFLWMNIADYLKLLTWTSQQRVGSLEKPIVPKDLPQILNRLGIDEIGRASCRERV